MMEAVWGDPTTLRTPRSPHPLLIHNRGAGRRPSETFARNYRGIAVPTVVLFLQSFFFSLVSTLLYKLLEILLPPKRRNL